MCMPHGEETRMTSKEQGAGTGTQVYGWKGGIGTSSRVITYPPAWLGST